MEIESIRPLILRPHWIQYCLCQLGSMAIVLLLAVATAIAGRYDNILKNILLAITILALSILLYRIINMRRIRYIITEEQILYQHGVFSYVTDYIELYRVYDYQQNSDLLQQITGMKTVIVMANDRNTPVMNIIGIKKDVDIITQIRRRVEYNKERKQVYEIGNRY